MVRKILFTLSFLFLQSIVFANTIEDYRNEFYQEMLLECNNKVGQEKAMCQCQANIATNDVVNSLTAKEKDWIINNKELSDEVYRELENKILMTATQSLSNMDNAIQCSKSIYVADCVTNGAFGCNHSKSCCECMVDAAFDSMTYKEMMETNPTPELQSKILQILNANHARCVKN